MINPMPPLTAVASIIPFKMLRSFARIHETNLKKQGILPLTFADPKDYDLLEQNDRVSVTGLAALAPGKPVTGTVSKPDGRALSFKANPTLTAEQIGWRKACSRRNA